MSRSNGAWLQTHNQAEIDEFLGLWDRARDSFRSAQAATTVIQGATAQEARHAFLRICRVGVPMTQEDFDNAVGWNAGAVPA